MFISTIFSLKEFAISNSSVTNPHWSVSITIGDFRITLPHKELKSLQNLFALSKLSRNFFPVLLFSCFFINRTAFFRHLLYHCSSSGVLVLQLVRYNFFCVNKFFNFSGNAGLFWFCSFLKWHLLHDGCSKSVLEMSIWLSRFCAQKALKVDVQFVNERIDRFLFFLRTEVFSLVSEEVYS